MAGIRRDGRPQLTPNWFYWDGERFYVSTTRSRAKYAISGATRGPSCSSTTPPVSALCWSRPRSRSARTSSPSCPLPGYPGEHGMKMMDDQEHLRALEAEGRVLLAITPDTPPSGWTTWGLD